MTVYAPSNVPRIYIKKEVAVIPTITAGAYTTGLQVGGVMEIDGVLRQFASDIPPGGQCKLENVKVIDADKQNMNMDIWFFSQNPTIASTDHASFAMTYANAKLAADGFAQVTSYSSAAAISIGQATNCGLILQVPATSATPNSVYAVAVSRGTGTFTGTGNLTFIFTFSID